ncbi:Uncharacterised protein [Yersinia frederiksenii]|uniref:Uncharacterized protein n=2 Tax=Yersinia frederiksenii TaxID=29484 RepID=A0A380PX84_YERFR|nr:hypothetical protein CRN75_20395 [Yersinia frederiksenii]KGA45081.1 hypothetical protein DJ58_987 [Yersinia frederiksenii ATCC 33641]SUP78093.1 Uncharacterised protein [Yersinia frederiksenii]
MKASGETCSLLFLVRFNHLLYENKKPAINQTCHNLAPTELYTRSYLETRSFLIHILQLSIAKSGFILPV